MQNDAIPVGLFLPFLKTKMCAKKKMVQMALLPAGRIVDHRDPSPVITALVQFQVIL